MFNFRPAKFQFIKLVIRRSIIALAMILFCQCLNAQNENVSIARNLVYLEGAGAGGYGSVNYERIAIVKKALNVSVRLGLSTYHIKDFNNKFNPDLMFPVMINGYYGNKHKVVLGAGQSFASIVQFETEVFKSKRANSYSTLFSLGYQYQKPEGGIMFRLAYTPFIEFNKYFRHYAGASIGYSF